MAILGYSLFGETVLGINEVAGKLGGVLTIMHTEPLWMVRHEGKPFVGVALSSSPDHMVMIREESAAPIILTRLDGDA